MNISHLIEKKEHLANILELDIYNLNSSSLRFYYNYIIKNHKRIKGDIIDLGVFRGKSLLTIAYILKKLKSKKTIYGFDTFSGFTKLNKKDQPFNFKNLKYFSKSHRKNSEEFWKLKERLGKTKFTIKNISSSIDFSGTSLSFIENKIKILNLKNVQIIKGDITKTIPKFFSKNSKKIMACNFDIDLYEPYKIALPYIWGNLVKGGYIHLDEYYSLKFPGPRIAILDFLRKNKIKINYNNSRKTEFKRCYIKK